MALLPRHATVFLLFVKCLDGQVLNNPSVTDLETTYMRAFNSKSCTLELFMLYLNARSNVASFLSDFYQRAFFRTNKYSVYLGTRHSQDRLVDRIRNMFGTEGRSVVVLWGNWGQRPNARMR